VCIPDVLRCHAVLCCAVLQLLGGNNIGTIKLQPVLIQKVRLTPVPPTLTEHTALLTGLCCSTSTNTHCTHHVRTMQ